MSALGLRMSLKWKCRDAHRKQLHVSLAEFVTKINDFQAHWLYIRVSLSADPHIENMSTHSDTTHLSDLSKFKLEPNKGPATGFRNFIEKGGAFEPEAGERLL